MLLSILSSFWLIPNLVVSAISISLAGFFMGPLFPTIMIVFMQKTLKAPSFGYWLFNCLWRHWCRLNALCRRAAFIVHWTQSFGTFWVHYADAHGFILVYFGLFLLNKIYIQQWQILFFYVCRLRQYWCLLIRCILVQCKPFN